MRNCKQELLSHREPPPGPVRLKPTVEQLPICPVDRPGIDPKP